MGVIIRKEEERDYKRVYEVNRLAFQQEDESQLVVNLRKSDNFVPELSLVAEVGNEVVGHILFTRIKIAGEYTFDSLILAPMAVIPEFQRKRIGSKLIERSIEKAKELGFDSIIVVGHKDYYPRFGFQRASSWRLNCHFEVPDEAFMVIELIERALGGKGGTIEFPREFMEFVPQNES